MNQQETQDELSEDTPISIDWNQKCSYHLPLLHLPYTSLLSMQRITSSMMDHVRCRKVSAFSGDTRILIHDSFELQNADWTCDICHVHGLRP